MAAPNRGYAQVFVGQSGSVRFLSDAPLELIQASSEELKSAIRLKDRSFAFRVRINSFQGFNSSLQRDHFNENYLESNAYPEATFTGKIIESIDLRQPGTYTIRAKGTLRIHGQARERIIKSQLISDGTTLRLTSHFTVLLQEHDIAIPRIVNQKIAEEIEVTVAATLVISE
jgi:polyisoprenoid-binding protein YceI